MLESKEKKCSACKETKPIHAFGFSITENRYQRFCKICNIEYQADARKKNPYRNHHTTVKEVEMILEYQDYKCAICRRLFTDVPRQNRKSWNLDHNHDCCPGVFSCGECIRGILCHHCNVMLCAAGDNYQTLQNAIQYLKGEHHNV